LPLLRVFVEAGDWTVSGVIWSLAGGAAGALGALGIIMAFNFGGKPIYVMPLVFGGAPVINTFTTILHEGTYQQTTSLFYASLMLVIGGAVTVLVFAPRGKAEAKPPKAKPERKKAKESEAPERRDVAPSVPHRAAVSPHEESGFDSGDGEERSADDDFEHGEDTVSDEDTRDPGAAQDPGDRGPF